MKRFVVFYFNKKITVIACLTVLTVILAALFALKLHELSKHRFNNSFTGVVVIDPGHGGIDGGTSKGSVLEKDINLDISKRIKADLEAISYNAVLTREEDKSLDNLTTGGSRHQRDLKARVNIINNSNAQIFVSIHGNYSIKNPSADGSIVLYSSRFPDDRKLAGLVQNKLNDIVIDGQKRTFHSPQKASQFYLLNNSNIPGVIVETGFLSNSRELGLLLKDSFKEQISQGIADAIAEYFNGISRVNGS